MVKVRSWFQVVVLALVTIPATYTVATPLSGAQSAEQWLQTMVETSRASSFSGHSVLMSGGRVVSMEVYHAPFDGEVWERVVQMSGDPAEIIRQGNEVYCLHPEASMGMALKLPIRRLTALDQSMQSISRYYHFEKAGNERVAGRTAVRFNLSPTDTNRFGYSVWLDEATGVLLKAQTVPATGEPLEMFEFVSISVNQPLTKADFEPGPGLTRSKIKQDGDLPETPARHWQPEWLPEGFVESQRVARFQGQGDVTARAYTDGLASFTVFYEPRSDSITENASTRGATVAIHRNVPGAMVTVVGEIPLETAQRVADSVKPLAEAR